MKAFRLLLGFIFFAIAIYTAIVVADHGMGLLPIFFGDMATMTWPGQFNFDFMCFLILSALWLSWRHHFSPTGWVMGLFGLFGGALFLSAYLLIVSFKVNGNINAVLLGETRANAS